MPLAEYESFEKDLEAGVEGQERIATLWMLLAYPDEELHLLPTPQYASYDFLVVERSGIIKCAIEVKYRRTSLDDYETAMFPWTKFTHAQEMRERHGIKTLGVSRYTDGLGECDLTEEPDDEKWFKRKGHHSKATKHGLWKERRRWKL